MRVGVAWPPGTEAPAFPVPPDAPWPGLLIFPGISTAKYAAERCWRRLAATSRAAHFCGGGLKYLKSGGGWSFLVGISNPSALNM
jgi:hypothetical protein